MFSGGSSARIVRNGFVAMLVGSLLLAAGAASAAQLTLNWVDNSDGTATFAIERTTATTVTYAQIATTGAGVITYTDPDVVAGTTYCYRVKASNVSGDSGYSNEACGAPATQSDGTASGPVPAITASVGTVTVGGTLTATWSNIPSPSPTDWIGLFQPGAPDTAFIDWVYVSCSKTADSAPTAGSCPFAIPSTLPLGTYELRLLANNGFARLAASAPLVVASAPVGSGNSGAGNGLSDPAYREGFGKDVTGGAGQPVCMVTSSASSGDGTLDACFQPGDTAGNMTIVFAVPTATLPGVRYLGDNVTIDGCANGQNGVTLDFTDPGAKHGIALEDPHGNVIFRCLNFRGNGTPDSGVPEADQIALDGTNGNGSVNGVLIDRCTFWLASNKAIDVAGNVSNVTIQRSMFYDNAGTMLIKYDTRTNISIHHNVFTRNGERNPQVKGDMLGIDYVNNVIYLNDVPNYPDGSPTSNYGVRIWSANGRSDSPGNVVGNFVNNATIGDGAGWDIIVDSGASLDGVYIAGTLCGGGVTCPSFPSATPYPIPSGFQITTLQANQLASMLPYVGAPNRTPLDQQRLDDVAAVLP